MNNFVKQLMEDLELIQQEWGYIDSNLEKDEYAFNYWILSRLYNVDEQVIPSYITEYNDKNIDCFVHFEESKELYIIQNKYYSEDVNLLREKASDFLVTPLTVLNQDNYKRSLELQKIFNKAKKDDNYKIWLHMYVTNDKIKNCTDIVNMFKNFSYFNKEVKAFVGAELFDINKIKELYFGKRYKEDMNFSFTLNTKNRATSLNILPEQYDLPGMIKSHYIMTPVLELYEMYISAEKKEYPLFEDNIREYLGNKGINNGIIKTLKSKEDRNKFFYFNNGITIICESTGKKNTIGKYSIELNKPQIVNGCQTMNSIYEVLSAYPEQDLEKEFKNTYVISKILVFNKDNENTRLYRDIVKYTNSQNAINDKAFASSNDYFFNLQSEFLKRGFLLSVKPSDKYKFKNDYLNKYKLAELKRSNARFYKVYELPNDKWSDFEIPLEKLLQVFLAFKVDGYFAFTKKNSVLKRNTKIFEEYSLRISEYLSIDNMIMLFLLYKKAESDKKNSPDKKTPIPYYVIDYLSYMCDNNDFDSINNIFKNILWSKEKLEKVYKFTKKLAHSYRKEYYEKYKVEYNEMIKKEIDKSIVKKEKEKIIAILEDQELKRLFL